ncbi:MAG: arginine--tRNA ligase [Flavobacteriales bacterium]|nr:arginine--tRNA ligase [Flavobacteriales bacterium]
MNPSYDIQQMITKAAQQAVLELFGTEATEQQIQLQKTRKEFEGDVTLVVFPLVKISKKSPEQTGELVGDFMKNHVAEVVGYNVVKGFLNISLTPQFWLSFFHDILQEEKFGFEKPDSGKHVMIEYSSPNTNKPLHLGHLRNNFLGYAVSEMMKAVGHKVTKVQIINDRGIHICKSMVAWKNGGQGETPQSSGMKGDKLVGKYYVEFDKALKAQSAELIAQGINPDEAANKTKVMQEAQDMLRKWEAKDPEVMELWRKMNGWVYEGFDITYKAMGVDFDKLYYESDTYINGKEEVEKGLEKGVFFKKDDGSVWIDLTDEGLDEKAVLRKDGTAMYITQDIGTAILRFRDFPDLAYQIYTVGNEQEYHFKVLLKILKRLGFTQADQCYHLSYGMVELPEGKMKSREGTVVDADDLMSEMALVAEEVSKEQGKLEGLPEEEKKSLYHTIGMAALKFFLLRVDPKKNMMFNPKESIDFNGNTGPSVQYTYVRTVAVLRKAKESGYNIQAEMITHVDPASISKAEFDVIRKIYEWPEVLHGAAQGYNPADIAHYCYDLAREFNSFYHDHQILRETDEKLRLFRIALTAKTGETIRNSMNLLGIQMPERM